ncbi:hypothetical protein BDR05DRAFT_896355 [Suillus weaverae]|nr:hypothetical protein BDR05DRAFT_896355 [Suillus weaverae]
MARALSRRFFSAPPKKAILNWARELGARDVPLLGTIKKVQEHIDCLVGDPTEKVSACLGDTFYINNVAESIAMVCLIHCLGVYNIDTILRDYANPPTQFAMQDYITQTMEVKECRRCITARKWCMISHHRQQFGLMAQ